ncbi:hypothetical protein HJG60_009344 [Phyllostomus discolor]|uniref:Uncharacterized protein n=1 Tax=Phyllostomus discolor TaxID=89673 RepID=A0A833YGA0_9CHIR|nr:hypothetical protein HJG60_009344 [Phyllostomus discolor]
MFNDRPVGNRATRMLSAALQLQKGCRVLGAERLSWCCFGEIPERHNTAVQSPGVLLAPGGKRGKRLACKLISQRVRVGRRPRSALQVSPWTRPALTRAAAAKIEAVEMERCGCHSPTHSTHNTGFQHPWTQCPLFTIFI